jgi:RNA polymerase sigma-70 factor (family 1)
MSKQNDSFLVNGLHSGDIPSFDALYHHYHPAIYSNIIKLVKDTAVAQDILQDVFTALWERRFEINPDQSVSGWLFVLSFNKSISYLRQKLREEKTISQMTLIYDDTDIDDLIVQEGQYQLLMNAIDELSIQKKKVFTLCKLEGKTYEEAATTLNISKHTVKEYLSIAVASVKKYIEQHPEQFGTMNLTLFITYWINS